MERDQITMEAPFLNLPLELMIIVISQLSSRDIVKLRYVSQRLRTVSETPSLWREFVWDYYDIREELCVKNVLKRCGEHIKRLAFPGYLTPKLNEMLQYCNNVRHVSLPVVMTLSPDQLALLGEAVQHMKHLHTLDIGWDGEQIKPLLLVGSNLKELTVYSGLRVCGTWINEWLDMTFRPANLNILIDNYDKVHELEGVVQNWQLWNSKVPPDHFANLKIYGCFKAPLSLYSIVPIFQLQFGHTAVLPFVQPEQCGLQGLDCLQVTDCCEDGKIIYKATNTLFSPPQWNNSIAGLHFLTQLDVMKCDSLTPSYLEQLAITCPNLQRLVLSRCTECLTSLHGLRAVARYCQSLQGLHIMDIPVTELESQLQFWEILSTLKLTHLTAEYCVFSPCETAAEYKEKIICLYQKCSKLVAIESKLSIICENCGSSSNKDFIPCQFPSLRYLKMHISCSFISLQDIITSCKDVQCFRIHSSYYRDPATLSHASNNNLKQLFLLSRKSVVLDSFMSSVSAHGGLVHVLLFVKSISVVGISVLIENSPKLITFYSILEIRRENSVETLTDKEFVKFEDSLKRKYSNRRLFNIGGFVLLQESKQNPRAQILKSLLLRYTDLQAL